MVIYWRLRLVVPSGLEQDLTGEEKREREKWGKGINGLLSGGEDNVATDRVDRRGGSVNESSIATHPQLVEDTRRVTTPINAHSTSLQGA